MTVMRFYVLSSPAPPLTLDNILEAVKNVQSWCTLGECIYSPLSSELDAIQRQHISDEACLKAVIEGFLSDKGCYKPSWRAVIWSLYEANEIQLAEHSRSFAEPVKGMERDIMDGSMLHIACFTGCTHCTKISVMYSCSSRSHSDCGECYWSDGECGSGEKEGGVVWIGYCSTPTARGDLSEVFYRGAEDTCMCRHLCQLPPLLFMDISLPGTVYDE